VASGSGDRTLTLTGASTGSLASVVADPSVGVTSLVKNGNGTWTLSGSSTFTGGTTILNGTLTFGANNVLANAGAVNVNGGTLNVATFNDTVGAVTLTSGSITGSTGVLTGSSYDVQSGSVSAILGGSGSMTKTTAGSVTLTRANTYNGGTTISAGTLLANNTTGSATGTGAVTVANGGTLAGNGAVNGAVTVNGGGTLAPGNSIDSLNVGAITFGADGNGGSTFAVELYTNAPLSVAADLLNANGNLGIVAGAILSLVDAGNTILTHGTKFTLISYAGTWDNGIFVGHPDDSLLTVGVNNYIINYNDTLAGLNFGGGDHGKYLTLTASVPEASAFLFGGMVCFVLGLAYGIRVLHRRRAYVAASLPRRG
jgi:autotransporter-associated beta strand protein